MPLLREFHLDEALLMIWQLAESESDMLALCQKAGINPHINAKNAKRRMESMAELLMLASKGLSLSHNEDGKPIVSTNPRYSHISISHSGEFVVVALCGKAIGIDIEKVSERIAKVRSHFLRLEEIEAFPAGNLELNTTAWTAKEALYKAAGIRNLTWQQGILPTDMKEPGKDTMEWSAMIAPNGILARPFKLVSQNLSGYILTLATLG